jgi:hypothetical protein
MVVQRRPMPWGYIRRIWGFIWGGMPLTNAKLKALKPKAKPYKLADYDITLFLTCPTSYEDGQFIKGLRGKL